MSVRKFTGWHMTGILVAFFGVVISVNVFMARAAISTFGGTVVDNSYVASQEFNGWLAKAAAQKARGWTVSAHLDGMRHVVLTARVHAEPLRDAMVEALVRHPLGRVPERRLQFDRTEDGIWTSHQVLPVGRWIVHLTVRRGGEEHRQVEDLL